MRFHSITDIGKLRSLNQDSLFVSDGTIGTLPNLFVAADGMGGHNAGEYASQQAIAWLTEYIRRCEKEQPVAVLEEAIRTANLRLYREASADESKQGMGTTMVAATIVDRHLIVANVGDSRLYTQTGDALVQVTRDHSVVEEMVRMGKITQQEALHHPKKRMITRAVGAEEDVRIDFFDCPMDGIRNILLCTDGLTNMVSDDGIFAIVNSGESVEARAKRLIAAANESGGRDNITVILIDEF